MRLAGVDFPRRLTEALESDELVVFAGAGVSMGTPANLPNFEDLATAVAAGTGEGQQEGEPADRFLGRLKDRGTNVHERAADTLRGGSPEPTALHGDLLRLYRTPQSVRVVTTNFDALFEQAAADVFDGAPSAFTAPALPLGNSFSGIVHVHGDLGHPQGMVLTDADFGRAYLTEGWARRFLVDLFRTHTVLFVGYSHGDTVMNYLSRALTPGAGDRFALTDEPDNAKWQLLGVEPIGYEKSAVGDHSALGESVRRLADYSRQGLLDWQRDIAEIAKNPPPLDDEAVVDLIDDALSDPERCRFFTDAASHVDWIAWLERRGYLAALFGAADLTERDGRLARWLGERFARDHASVLFLLIGRNRLRVHPSFWWELARVVQDKDRPLSAAPLARWVSLLLATASRTPDTNFLLLSLGERCAEAGLTDALLDVFDAMAAGGLAIEPGFALVSEDDGEPAVRVEVVRQHRQMDQFSLERLYEDHLKPNLQEVAESLLERVARRLEERHRTLRSWQQATRDHDAMSLHRSAIEPHEQDQDRSLQSIDVLINAARDALEHLVTTRPDAGARWCDRLVVAEVPLLRRLAVHALPNRSDLGADEQVTWLLSRIGLYDRAAHHETFLAVRASYPGASTPQRQATIEAIREYEWPTHDDDSERYTAYGHLEWFQWLSDSDPGCDLAKEALEGIRQRYPDFRPSEHPDLTHYHSTSWGRDEDPDSPWSVEELLSRPAGEWLERLVSFRGDNPFEPNRDGLLRSVGEAAQRDFTWGLALADALAESEEWDSALWTTLLRAWSGELDEDKHRHALARLRDAKLHRCQTQAIAEMLLALIKDGGLPYAPALLEESNHLARSLWAHCDQDDREPGLEGWLTRAINHPAGALTQYWLGSLSLWRNQHETRPEGMDEEHSSALLHVIQERAVAGRLGRTVLARSLGFLLAADEAWTREHLIPLFEDADGDDYQAVWDGFLYGRMDRNVVTAMEDAIFAAVPHMSDLFPSHGQHRKAFIALCTDVVTYVVDDPLDAWTPEFFKAADDSDKRLLRVERGQAHPRSGRRRPARVVGTLAQAILGKPASGCPCTPQRGRSGCDGRLATLL